MRTAFWAAFGKTEQKLIKTALRVSPSVVWEAWLCGKDINDALTLNELLKQQEDDSRNLDIDQLAQHFQAAAKRHLLPAPRAANLWSLDVHQRRACAGEWATTTGGRPVIIDNLLELHFRLAATNTLQQANSTDFDIEATVAIGTNLIACTMSAFGHSKLPSSISEGANSALPSNQSSLLR